MSTPYASLYTAERVLDISYKEGVAAVDQVYPDTDTYDILGQLYAPRIYGKNLTAIEVASSGIIAFTMQDIHALDVDRDAASSNVILRTVANDGLLLSLTDCNVGSLLLGNDSNVALKAGDTASFTAGNGMALSAAGQMDVTASNVIISGCNIAFTSGSDMTIASDNLLFYGSNEVSIQSGSNLLSFTPTSGLLQTVDGPLTVSACNDLSIYTTNLSADASSNISLVSDCNVTMLAGPNVIAVTPDTATVQSGDNLLSMTPQQATLQAGSNLFITSGATATVAASNDLFMESSGNASLTAANTAVTATTTVTTTAPTVGAEASTLYYVNATSIDIGASNALLLAGTDVTASGADALTLQSGSNVLAFTPTTALIQSVDNAMQISACNDLAFDTQVFSLTTSSNLTVASACNLTLVAPGGALLVTPSNVVLTSDSNIEITSVTDMTIRSENDLYLTAACNLVINASNLSLPLSNFNMNSTGNMSMSAAGVMTLGAGESLYLMSGSNFIEVSPSNIQLAVADGIFGATACNSLITAAETVYSLAATSISVSASNGVSFQSDSNMNVTASTLSLTGDSQVLLWSGANKLSITPSITQFGDSNSYLTLTSTGTVEQSTTTQVTTTDSVTISSPDIAADSSATLALTAQSNFDVTASHVSIATPTGEQKIELDDGTGILIDSADRILVTANDAFSAQGGMLIDGATHEVFMASQTPTDAVMSSLKCIDSNVIAFASSNQQYFIGSAATGTPILQLTASGTSTFGTQHDIFATNSNVAAITMYRDSNESVLHVLGRVDLDGAINTINKSNLDIVDKVVMFASPDSSNVDLTDGMVNDRSGIYIYGKPAAASFSNAPQPGDVNDVTQRFYEKSMIWNMGAQGMDRLGSATGIDYSTSILNESYWQLRGGNLQLTTAQSDGSNVRDTSYGFRINSRGELELYKHHWLNGEYKAKKLKMWGHMVDSQFPAR